LLHCPPPFFDDGSFALCAEDPTGVQEPGVPISHNGTLIENQDHHVVEAYDNVPGTMSFPLTFVDLHANTFARSTYQKVDGSPAALGTSVIGSASFRPPSGQLQLIPAVTGSEVRTDGEIRYESTIAGQFGSLATMTTRRVFPDPVIGRTMFGLDIEFDATDDIALATGQPFPANDRFRVLTVSSMFASSTQFDANWIRYEDASGNVRAHPLTDSTPRGQHLFAAPDGIGTWFELVKTEGSTWFPDSPTVHVDITDKDGLRLGLQGFLDTSTDPNDDSLSVWLEWLDAPDTVARGTGFDLGFQVVSTPPATLDSDFGDAPDQGGGAGSGNYNTLSGDGGPQHTIVAGLFMGARVDAEPDATPTAAANGDDTTIGPDDEDGVAFPQADFVVTVGAAPTVNVFVTNTTGTTATLYGWIDYNADGMFDNATERASLAVPTGTVSGTVTLAFPAVPVGSAGSTYARFRLSTDATAANPTGAASDGEVEDYTLTINLPADQPVSVDNFLKIASGAGGGPTLANDDSFGSSVSGVGDLDGDGVADLAVGTDGDDTGGPDRGAVYMLLMNADGTVKRSTKIASGAAGGPTLANDARFGSSVSSVGDLDGDGVADLAVGAVGDNTGGPNRGAVYMLLMNADGTVKGSTKIASGAGGGPTLANGNRFGSSVSSVGDVDGDGVADLAVGADGDSTGGTNRGAVYVLRMNADGTVRSSAKIASGAGGGPTLADLDFFGSSVTSPGDLDGDGVADLAVGADGDDTGGSARGAVHVLLLNADGAVKSSTKVASGAGGGPTLATDDRFGSSVSSVGDLDGDGVADLAVGAVGDNTGGTNRGAVYVLLMNTDGTVKSSAKIASGVSGGPTLVNADSFGSSVTSLGDLNGDGVADLAAGADGDDTGGSARGAAHVLFLKPSDLTPPTVIVDIVDAALHDGDNNSTVTFEFSEGVTGFDSDDLTAVGGSLSNFQTVDANSYTATFTAFDGGEATGSVSVGTNYTDLAGNGGGAGSDTVAIDTLNPTVTVDIVDSSLNDGDNNSDVTFEFSENVAGFDAGDVTVNSGTLSNFTPVDGNSFTATFTADDGVEAIGSVAVAAGSYTDTAGNGGAAGSDTVPIDALNPTLTVNIVDAALNDGDNNSDVTFEFSENVAGFDAGDVTVSNGTLANFTPVDGNSFTATFTADDGVEAIGSLAVAAGGYTDTAGNSGAAGLDTVPIDALNPTLTVNIVDAALNDGDNNSDVTFEFSENVTGFDAGDVTVSNGTLSNFTAVDENSFTATFTAADGVEATGSVAVAAGSYTDTAGNGGAAGSDTVTVDTLNPTLTVDIVDSALGEGDNSSDVTFEFSENVAGFDADDVTVSSGTLSNFTAVDGNSFTATFAGEGVEATGSVAVAAGSYTDAAGNSGTAGSDTVTIDKVNPTLTVTIVDSSLSDGNNSSDVTFEFSENVAGFDADDVTVSSGTLSNFTAVDGNSFTATFTADNGVETTGSALVSAASYTDTAGNSGAAGSDTVMIDTLNPTVTVNIVDNSLNDGDNIAAVTFQFSENVTGFDASEVAVSGGTLSNFTAVDGNSFAATFTADDGVAATGSVAVPAASYTDAAGNSGADGSDTVTIDTLNPTLTVSVVDAALNDGDNSSDVTFEFSEDVTGFDAGDVTVSDGTLSNFTAVDGNSFTATFTADDGVAATGSVAVPAASYTDAAGNSGTAGSDTVTIDTLAPTLTVSVVDATLNDGDNSSDVTFEFSENVTGFDADDVTVNSGTLSNFTPVDGNSFTATFTAGDGVETIGSAAVAAGGYTDTAGNSGAAGVDMVTIDTLNPKVGAVQIVRDAKGRKVVQVIVVFGEPIATGPAETPANYVLTVRKGTRIKPVVIATAAYDAAAMEVALTPVKPIAVRKLASYTLTVRGDGTLTDLVGNAFDGDADDVPGGDFALALTEAIPRAAVRQAATRALDAVLDADHVRAAILVANDLSDRLLGSRDHENDEPLDSASSG
jgi:plastocyanin